jgi:hypothetical protein
MNSLSPRPTEVARPGADTVAPEASPALPASARPTKK